MKQEPFIPGRSAQRANVTRDCGARRSRPALGLLALLGLVAILVPSCSRKESAPSGQASEASRQNLELRDGRFFLAGQTNAFSGLMVEKYSDGAVKSRSQLVSGLLQGASQGYYTNGQQQIEEPYVAGTSHGLRTKWHPDGRKQSEVTVVDGRLHGTFRSWHENGARAEEVELKDGLPDGLSRAWFPSGFLKSQVHLSDGKVVDQKFWKDGEYREAASPSPGLASGK